MQARRRIPAFLSDERAGLAAVLLLAAAVRLVAAGSRLNIDDAYSWLIGSSPSPHVFLAQLAASENTPPLFYLLLAGLSAGSAWWLRFPAAASGILMCLVIYLALRRPFGTRVALLSALALAAAPLLVTYSNLARGFTLEDLALLICLWAMLRLSEGESRRWWVVYGVAGVVAVYTEYDAVIFLLALAGAALWTGRPDRRRVAVLGALPVAALLPWLPRLIDGQDAIGKTKLSPSFPGPSPASLRDLTVTLLFGEHGGSASTVLRWLVLIAVIAVVAWGLVGLRSSYAGREPHHRALALIAGAAALTLAGHLIVAAFGTQVFNARYLTILIPLVAALAAAALVASRRRAVFAVVAAALAAVALVNVGRRYQHQWEPNLSPVRALASSVHARTVLTNNPVVLYYLSRFRPILDRPYNLGPGQAAGCARPCLIVDDTRVQGGRRRRVSGARWRIGPFRVTLETR